MSGAVIKGIGIAATAIGMAATFATDWVNEKKMEEKIEEKVNEALSRRDNNNEGES
ncbi:hypothetical protein [uncultured Phocaeicola sp.]|uniref:hypothetical protein n=1 Tax=uncultured Phocaeicola sp. TaxID=990718 RepID=UPI0026323819|nr:hypothetical protein [uncultured Phocaeicola sp.]